MTSPKYMRVVKKTSKYIAKPMPGRHTLQSSVALSTLMKEILGLGNSTYEVKKAIKEGKVRVNGKGITDERYPVGFEDLVEIVPSNDTYKIGVDSKGRMSAKKSDDKSQVFKIVGKYVYKGGKTMLRLHDGSIVSAVKDSDVNDSVKLNGSKVEKVIKLQKGAECLIINGMHSSKTGKIVEIKKGTIGREPTVEIEGKNGRIETVLRNVVVIGA
jgi:small subunit ribosomal protein S4e